eukprot:14973573-Alexandrium_andersonii.AAC.1
MHAIAHANALACTSACPHILIRASTRTCMHAVQRNATQRSAAHNPQCAACNVNNGIRNLQCALCSMPCRAMPCRAVPCHAMSCRAMPCRFVPCRAMPRRATPCHAMHGAHALVHAKPAVLNPRA